MYMHIDVKFPKQKQIILESVYAKLQVLVTGHRVDVY